MKARASHRLLIVDDDAALNQLLVEYFSRFGHRLTAATTAAAGRALLEREDPDLLILDVMLPDADGLELCRSIRATSDLPIVLLTARGEVSDRVLGLELGADDYVAKPFEPRELVARVEGLMRRSRPAPPTVHRVDDLLLEVETRRVVLDGVEIELTAMEFDLLRTLMKRRGRVLSRDVLLQSLGGAGAEVYDRSIDMLISRLRAKLGDDSRRPRFIRTIRGAGYQFVGSGDAS
jgi:two-component system, OmpR family, response regulator